MGQHRTGRFVAVALVTATLLFKAFPTFSQEPSDSKRHNAKRVIEFWTKDRRAKAIPRDLVIDNRGLGYLRKADGSLLPYGHSVAANQLKATNPTPQAKPGERVGGNNSDTTPPEISGMTPDGVTIGTSQLFSATVTDNQSGDTGVKSVSFVISYPNGTTTQSFRPSYVGNDTWEITLSGFSDGNWSWEVVAKDSGDKGGNTARAGASFTVGGSADGGDSGDQSSYIVTNDHWSAGGTVQTAAGRLYFQMPNNAKRRRWVGYVCSGTVATEAVTGRSIIITAAHCVYDDANKAFARNVLFIPNQDNTSGSGTDTDCSNDPIGCWAPSFGVVDENWATRTFPANIPWDYAYYVVSDTDAHISGVSTASNALDQAAGSLPISFVEPMTNDGDPSASSIDFTHALGYSYSDDPNFMYCAEDMTVEGEYNDWWLASCGLSGGSSGGPWVQPLDETTGSGPLISVNSWGYSGSLGMAGPRLALTSAACLFNEAKGINFTSVNIENVDGEGGVAVNYCN